MTFDVPLDEVDATFLELMQLNAVCEGRHLEYKESLPVTSDDKKEFLADVTSFSNAAGGDLIFGVREKRDGQGKPTGEIDSIPGILNLNFDAERMRFENLLRDAVEPRLPPIAFRSIPYGDQRACLLVRIPRSWTGLHMVKFQGMSRFYGRNSGGKYPLDVHEIRAGFVAAETAYDRARRFRLERVSRVLAGETPVPIDSGPRAIFHAIPVGSTNVWASFLAIGEPQRAFRLPPLAVDPSNWRFNADGFVTFTQHSNSVLCIGYAQLFRDGAIESVSDRAVAVHPSRECLYGSGIERATVSAFRNYQALWRDLGVNAPVLVGLVVTGVKGLGIVTADTVFDTLDPIDRDTVIVPEVVLEDLSVPAETALKGVFDMFWNAGGWPASPYYRNGKWTPPR